MSFVSLFPHYLRDSRFENSRATDPLAIIPLRTKSTHIFAVVGTWKKFRKSIISWRAYIKSAAQRAKSFCDTLAKGTCHNGARRINRIKNGARYQKKLFRRHFSGTVVILDKPSPTRQFPNAVVGRPCR